MNEESANDIIDGANFTLGLTILGGCVRTRKPKSDTIRSTKRPKLTIVKFSPIITLNIFNFSRKLGTNIRMKIEEGREDLGFM